jgi:hypothetical protein
MLELLMSEWEDRLDDEEYKPVHDALRAGIALLEKYYHRADDSGTNVSPASAQAEIELKADHRLVMFEPSHPSQVIGLGAASSARLSMVSAGLPAGAVP